VTETGGGVIWTNPALPPPWDPPAGEQWVWDAALGRWVAKVSPTQLDADPIKDPNPPPPPPPPPDGGGAGGDGGDGSGAGGDGGDGSGASGDSGKQIDGGFTLGPGPGTGDGGSGGKGLGRVVAGGLAGAIAIGVGAYGFTRGGSSTTGGGSSNNAAAGDAATTPRNNKVVIWNKWGRSKPDTTLINELMVHFHNEHYEVTYYNDPTEGGADNGTATLDTFAKAASEASIVIFDSHGFDPAVANVEVIGCGEKAIYRVPGDLPPSSATPLPSSAPQPSSCTIQPFVHEDVPNLVVEWYPDTPQGIAQRDNRYSYLLTHGWDESELTASGWRAPNSGKAFSTDGQDASLRAVLMLTAKGVAHVFAGKKLSIIGGITCHSLVFSPFTNADNYFGYKLPVYPAQSQSDFERLFNLLTGHGGVPKRDTQTAYDSGGYSSDFQLSGTQKIVLSPAVQSVTPPDGTLLRSGRATPGEVDFDAKMGASHADGIVKVSGCGATIDSAKWDTTDSKLTFQLRIPSNPPPGNATLTIGNTDARASPDGFANELDGNQDPAGASSGLEPNRDNYMWTVSCSSEPTPPTAPSTTAVAGLCNPGDVMLSVHIYGRAEIGMSYRDSTSSEDQTSWPAGNAPFPNLHPPYSQPWLRYGCFLKGTTMHLTFANDREPWTEFSRTTGQECQLDRHLAKGASYQPDVWSAPLSCTFQLQVNTEINAYWAEVTGGGNGGPAFTIFDFAEYPACISGQDPNYCPRL
jgi:hypothetical protein